MRKRELGRQSMKSKTFIIWNGLSARSIAVEVQRLLRMNNVDAVVGGETGGNSGLYVGQAVFMEMNSCDRTLCIIKKPNKGNKISENVYFELGYAIAKYGASKICIYLVDVERNALPSDLSGIWADDIVKDVEEIGTSSVGQNPASAECASNSDKNIANTIAVKYMAKQDQINVYHSENKMRVIHSYYKWRTYLKEYIDGTDKSMLDRYSDDELALYMLMFHRAAYLYEDVDAASVILKEYFDIINYNLGAQTSLLTIAVQFGRAYLEMIRARTHGKDVYLDYENYTRYHTILKNIRREYEILKEKLSGESQENKLLTDFEQWFSLKWESTLGYANILYAMSPDMDKEEKNCALLESIDHSKKSIEIGNLMKEHSDKELLLLYRIYDNRNIFRANQMMNSAQDQSYFLKEAYESAKELYYSYNGYYSSDSNDQLTITLEMEYRLICSEIVAEQNDSNSMPSGYEVQKIEEECKRFIKKIDKMKSQTKQQWYYNRIDSIKGKIRNSSER